MRATFWLVEITLVVLSWVGVDRDQTDLDQEPRDRSSVLALGRDGSFILERDDRTLIIAPALLLPPLPLHARRLRPARSPKPPSAWSSPKKRSQPKSTE